MILKNKDIMKKTLLFCFILFGCEIYELPSEPPPLTGGKWIFVDYEITIIDSPSKVEILQDGILKNDTICINSFNNISIVSGNMLMKQFYSNTASDRRFIRGKTVWEFDNYGHHLYCDFIQTIGSIRPLKDPYWVSYPKNYWEKEHSMMQILNQENGSATNYTMDTGTIGQGYPNKLRLLSPLIYTDLYGSGGGRDRGIGVKITLIFMR